MLAEIWDFLGVSLNIIEAHPYFFLNLVHRPRHQEPESELWSLVEIR